MKTISLHFYFMFLLCFSCSAQIDVPHTTEKITFQSDDFNVVGELMNPKDGDKHPLVIMVHGDGPAYRRYYSKLKECFLSAGYVTFIWDKPGYGESTGKFSKEKRLAERASILVDAVNFIKKHTAIDSSRIGVWGISQVGYVMPLAMKQTGDIRFIIAVGCPGMNGVDQTAYLIKKQLIFEGLPEEEALEAEVHFKQLFTATSFQEYIQHAKPLYDNPIQRKLGFVSALWDESNWKPHTPDEEGFFDPIGIIANMDIPVLGFFG